MNPWETYTARVALDGPDRRTATLKREQRFLRRKMQTSLSYHHLTVDGVDQDLAVINSDNLNEKTLCTLPGETVPCGGLVEWIDNHWLITELDANNEVYTRAKMEQCNYLLRWIADDGTTVERWCIIEDGTKLKRAA